MQTKVIEFHYTLKNPEGEILDSSEGQEPLGFITGQEQIVPGLEKALLEMKVGEKKVVQVPANEGYGERDSKYLINVSREELPDGDIEIGDQFQYGEEEDSHPFRVIAVDGNEITLDANHPLAGIDLTFEVEMTTIREATAEELDHGHVHGAHGHHHG